MKTYLRINNSNLVPIVPALDEKGINFLEAKTKGDTLTYSEMDQNFSNIMVYLVDVYNTIKQINTSVGPNVINQEKLDAVEVKLRNLIDSLTTKSDTLTQEVSDIKNTEIPSIKTKLDSKIQNIKTINNLSLVGTGNLDLNITRDQFNDFVTSTQFGGVGSYGFYKIKSPKTPGSSYSGSDLYYTGQDQSENTVSGTWRCLGATDTFGLFVRIV